MNSALAKAFLDTCRAALVDTSMRSRLLNYKPGSRGGAIEVVGEHPVAVWDALVTRGARLRLRGVGAEAEGDLPARPGAADGVVPAGEGLGPPAEAPAPAPGTGSARGAPGRARSARAAGLPAFGSGGPLGAAGAATHRDTWLDVNLPAEALATRALRLADTTRSSQEEQGVNTLFLALGFLCFRESESAQEVRLAPLLLVPAALERDGREGWRVARGADDPVVNPALVEYLRAQHGLVLPPGPDADEAGARDFDPAAWLQEVGRLVGSKDGWGVTGDCLLGIFSFQKFVMHQDLGRNADEFAGHPLVRTLAGRDGTATGMTRPPGIDALDLDAEAPVEQHTLVLDADSSQLRAVQAVVRGHPMVVIGPPGTGKSQTIVNIVASALDAGKTVLFVAEKQAALNVVYERLKRVGLGASCFEVHSGKASKAAVVAELRRSLDATLAAQRPAPLDAARLKEVRDRLNDYQSALHHEVEPLGMSAYGVMGRLARLSAAPATRCVLGVAGVSREAFQAQLARLAELEGAAKALPVPATHAWRGMQATELRLDARDRLGDALREAGQRARALAEALEAVRASLPLPATLTLSHTLQLGRLAVLLREAGGVEPALAAAWLAGADEAAAAALVARGEGYVADAAAGEPFLAGARTGVGAGGDAAVGAALAALVPAAAEVEARAASAWRWLVPAWHGARGRLRKAMVAGGWRDAAHAAAALRAALRAEQARAALGADAQGPALFGAAWRGAASDWAALAGRARWLVALRDLVRALALGPEACGLLEATRRAPAADACERLGAAAQALEAALRALAAQVEAPATWLQEGTLAQALARVAALEADPGGWRAWGEFQRLRSELRAGLAAPVLEEAEAGRVPWDDLGLAFERRFLERWLDERMAAEPALARFRGSTHQENIAEFRRLDAEAVRYHRGRLAEKLKTQAQQRLASPQIAHEVTFLRGQLARQKGHAPLRTLMREAGQAIRALKPCFLMSPLTVAMCLSAGTTFDIVIFDEASQLTPEDALGAIARGRQLVVVGDPKQLPPTSFFAVQTGQVQAVASDDPDALPYEEHESVLEHALAAGLHGTDLRWHYRSRHESLIAYSNRHFYESRLYTFPGVNTDRRVRGLSFVHVPEGLYEGSGTNRAEARRVVDAVVEHARTHPDQSLGVGTFSLAQQLAVQDELERRRRADPDLEAWLVSDAHEPFFVKNLESVQGDERDVIFLSITYGRSADGRLRQNFGPVNGPNGARRLNVLTTRARERMVVFSSMRAEDIDISSARSMGAQLLRAFLRYAETGSMEGSETLAATAATESPLEAEMVQALQEAGYRVQPQVGVAGYRIDIGVLDPEVPGRFVCGIEADGVAYHSAESARDRDRLRDEVLRGLGWRLVRVWSLDWWHDRKAVMERLRLQIDAATRAAREERQAGRAGGAPATQPVEAVGEPAPSLAAGVAASPAATAARGRVGFPAYREARLRTGPGNLLDAELEAVLRAMREVVREEGPLHEDDLQARVLQAFGHQRSGARLRERLEQALAVLQRDASLRTDRVFWWTAGGVAVARSRSGTGIPAARLHPGEYDAGVLAALAETGTIDEDDLLRVLQEAFGWESLTSAQRALHAESLSRLRQQGRVGIGGSGVALLGGA